MNIALVQKCPSKTDYERHFGLPISKVFNLCSKPISRVTKKDVDLEGFDPEDYDYVILVGSEPVKEFTKITAVTNYTGRLIAESDSKSGYKGFIASISPAVLAFKPENKPIFEATVNDIKNIIDGKIKTENEKDYRYITTTLEAVTAFNEALTSSASVIALDSETSSLEPREGYMLGISMSYKAHQGVYIDADVLDEKCLQLLQEIIDTKEVVFHNAKFDMKYFTYHLDIQFDHREGFVHDTMVMHYLLDERPGTHGLKPLAMKYTDLGDYDKELDEWKKAYCKAHGIKAEDFTYDLIPWDIIKVYAVKDTDATIQLFNKFYPILCNAERLIFCYENLQLPLMHFLKNMEDSGIPVSRARLELANKELDAQIAALKDELWGTEELKLFEEVTGRLFNPNSPQQVRTLLFDIIKLPVPAKRTGTGAISTDATVLLDLAEMHRVPELILEIKKMSKLKNTYINKLLPVINGDGKVRTGFHQITTTSGRLSSSGRFNMQQLPRDNPIIKGCVVAPEGYRIVALD